MTTDEKLDAILKTVASIEKRIAGITVKQAASNGVAPADDRDLDSQYGNPAVRKDPPKWTGDSFVGCTLSECSPEYLESWGSFKLWQAGKDEQKGDEEGKKKAGYNRRDAARAFGWAARLKSGWTAPERVPGSDDADDIPFA